MPRKLTMDMVPKAPPKKSVPKTTAEMAGIPPMSEIVSQIVNAVKASTEKPVKVKAKRVLSDEERAKRCDRLKLAREAKVAKRAALLEEGDH